MQVTFCLGQMGVNWFIKYLGLIGFCIILCALIMVSGPDCSNELRMVDSDDGSVSPVSPQHNYLEVLTAQLEYYDHSVFG